MRVLRQVAAAAGLSVVPMTLMGCGNSPTPAPPVYGDCEDVLMGTPLSDTQEVPTLEAYAAALQDLNMDEVKADMAALLLDSKDCWPADGDNYGPFMIRLAWHAAGTYRQAPSAAGGAHGGRQRFEPERSWMDNANLDKARALVYPLKDKYKDALSWGDLMMLAGTVAFEQAGMPFTNPICFGRIDEADGSASDVLNEPCSPSQGKCDDPHGATTVGLIYVNPEGPLSEDGLSQVADPALSVAEIRRTFGRMGASDEATVALIGGGHTIGKTHGACPLGGGNSPKEAFAQGTKIWEGQCGIGKGAETFTSGFEGYWTTQPWTWDNEFFTELLNSNWTVWTGPGGHQQWRTEGKPTIMRLTSDMALLEDASYKTIVESFAASQNTFNTAFDAAWYDLTVTNANAEWSTAGKCTNGNPPPAKKMRSDSGPEFVV